MPSCGSSDTSLRLVPLLCLSIFLSAEMADSSVIQCATSCTVTVVHELVFPPFQMTTEEGGQIALAIGAVWIVAWGFRMVIQVMKQSSDGADSET